MRPIKWKMTKPLPDFEDPPVVEVALSVQFDHLNDFRVQHVGQLSECYTKDFPKVSEQPPISPAYELFDNDGYISPVFRMELSDYSPLSRIWFVNDSDTRLIQIQRDRFVYNWRRASIDEAYPHYPDVRKSFEQQFLVFQKFLIDHKLTDLIPNQCEVTYVNLIEASEDMPSRTEANKLLTVFHSDYSDDYLSEPEDVRLALRYRIHDIEGNPVGRLHILLDPTYYPNRQTLLYRLTIVARGKPLGEGIEGVLGFFDLGRDSIVRGFTSITTKMMHKKWRRINDDTMCPDS